MARRRARQAGIYISGCAGDRTYSGETGCAAGVLPEAVTSNLNGRTLNPNRARQIRAGRRRRNSRPACRLIVYYIIIK
jgi:hypothetical protein